MYEKLKCELKMKVIFALFTIFITAKVTHIYSK